MAWKSDKKLMWNQNDIIPIKGCLLIEHEKVRSKQKCFINDEYSRKE